MQAAIRSAVRAEGTAALVGSCGELGASSVSMPGSSWEVVLHCWVPAACVNQLWVKGFSV